MKHYVEYMDSVEVSPALHRRLLELTAPEPKTSWKKYGAIAAALVLAVGLGAYGLGQLDLGGVSMDGAETGIVDAVDEGTFDGDLSGYDDANGDAASAETSEPAILDSYEVTDGEYAVCYLLQAIEYGWTDYEKILEISLSDGSMQELTGDEIADLLGGEDAILTHLDWNTASLCGSAFYRESGSLWLIELTGSASDGSAFTLFLSPEEIPDLTCHTYPEAVVNQLYDTQVSATASDGEDGSATRRVSFQAQGIYCGCTISGTDSQSLERLTSRLVRRLCCDGDLNLDAVTSVN
ncbi:MAG: hypothetical protein LIO42_00770 [Oscillospiraceae bacterium]|nr:hypothetical protein [Oscillospiraceae bacterium]